MLGPSSLLLIRVSIGRGDECDLVLDHAEVSRLTLVVLCQLVEIE